jgi:acetyl esterase/lipase
MIYKQLEKNMNERLLNLKILTRLLAAAVLLSAAALYSAEPEQIAIWNSKAPIGDGTFAATNAFITVYRPEKPNGAVIVICPGGAYKFLAMNPEGHNVARWLNEHGITGVVLEYRLPGGKSFVPLLDAQRALRTVRSKAPAWGCDPKRIGIAGFSAGGHLASTAATHFDGGDAQSADPVNRLSCRPDFAILVYPVITMGEKTHNGSKNNLLGKAPTPEAIALFSNEKQVTDQTPPTFLAHAQDDRGVSPDNSQMFFDALQAHNIPSEYLKLPSGGHGLDHHNGPMWEAWKTKSLEWLAAQNMIPLADAQSGTTVEK